MNKLLQMVPTVFKAVISVIVFILGLGWGSYQAVSMIAKAEAAQVREEIKAIRSVDMEHLNKRFDTIERLIKEDK